MYPRIPWEMVADPLQSAKHSLRTNAPTHRRTNPRAYVARATKLCSVARNICGPPLQNPLRTTALLTPRSFSWFQYIFFLENVCTPGPTTKKKSITLRRNGTTHCAVGNTVRCSAAGRERSIE